MITIRSNIAVVTTRLINQLSSLKDPRPLLRQVAIEVLPMITERIHEEGKSSDGSQIGLYSKGYMAVRTGVYGNSGRVSRGANKGKVKDAGMISRGPKKGTPRVKYNRTADKKVIVSLTRQLENDWNVIASPKGWGIGFNNPLNVKKIRWVEARKKKIISNLTTAERDYALIRFKSLISEKFNEQT